MADIIPPSAPAAPAPAPAPSAPSPAPSAPAPAAPSTPAAPAPTSSGGMKDFISKMGKPEPKPAATPEPVLVDDTPQPPKPDGAPAGDHPDVPDAVWDKAPKNLKNAYFKTKRELSDKLTANEARLKELENKPNQTPADLKRIKELEDRSTKLEKDLDESQQRLIQADYRSSNDFIEKYEKKGQAAYQRAIADVKQLQVKSVDADGNETFKAATEADFNDLRQLSPYEQDKKINEMFGTSAYRVSQHMRTLEALEHEANEAISTARTKAEEGRRTFQKQQEERNAEFATHSERAVAEISKAHAVYFAPDPANPEASAALERGLKYVDDAAKNQHSMSPKDMAETTAMIRFLAGSAPRLMTEINQLKAQLAAKDEELGKYRKSSPGSAPSASGAPKSAPEPEKRGVQAAIEQMKASVKR